MCSLSKIRVLLQRKKKIKIKWSNAGGVEASMTAVRKRKSAPTREKRCETKQKVDLSPSPSKKTENIFAFGKTGPALLQGKVSHDRTQITLSLA